MTVAAPVAPEPRTDPVPSTSRPAPVRARTRAVPARSAGRRRALRVAAASCALLGGLLLGFVGYLAVGSGVAQSRTQDNLYDDLRVALRGIESPPPVAAPIPRGVPVALLQIPSLGVEQVVLEGSSSTITADGPGHRPDTPLPGQNGVAVLQGHRESAGAPFRDLGDLRIGSRIVVTTGQGVFTYAVDNVRTSDIAPTVLPATGSRLTLVTSDPGWAPTRSLVVSAALLSGTAQPVTAALPTTLPADLPLEGDPAAALPLLLWSQALLIVAIGAVVAWRRLPHVVVWVAAGPLVLAVLWNVYGNAAALLPNTL